MLSIAEERQTILQQAHLIRRNAALMRRGTQHEAHWAADLSEVLAQPLGLAGIRHRQEGEQCAVEVLRCTGDISVHHLVSHPRGVAGCGNEILSHLRADSLDPAHPLDPGGVPHRASEPRCGGRLCRPAVKRHQRSDTIGMPVGQAECDGGTDRMRHDQRGRHIESLEHGGNPVSLGGERIVRMFRARRAPNAERLDDQGPISGCGQQLEHVSIPEGGAEQSGYQHDGGADTGFGDT